MNRHDTTNYHQKADYYSGFKKTKKQARKKKEEKKEKIKEEIINLGLSEHVDYLIQHGFTKYKRNLKYLKKYNYNKEEALNALITKQLNKLQVKENKIERFGEKFKLRQFKEVNKVKIWQPEYSHLIIDGNNLLFCEENLRKLTLINNENFFYGKLFLVMIVADFSRNLKIPSTYVYFDKVSFTINLTNNFLLTDFELNLELFQTFVESHILQSNLTSPLAKGIDGLLEIFNEKIKALPINSKLIPTNIEGVSVVSSIPDFISTDDAFVDLIGRIEPNRSVFVTSDVGLQERLYKKGLINYSTNRSFVKWIKRWLGESRYLDIINLIKLR